jgi:tetratricopeptide (TPR) repeat protein
MIGKDEEFIKVRRMRMRKGWLSVGFIVIAITTFTGCGTAGSFQNAGKKCFAEGKYEEAAANFSSAINKNPNRTDYYIDYGLSLVAMGNYEEAIVQFDQAYLEKDISIIRENNKRILRGKGIAYYMSKKYPEAIEQFDQALQISELRELDRDILYYKGSALMAIGSYDLATAVYTQILSDNKEDGEALLDRANCYRILGDHESSLADYDYAITLDPKNYDAYFGMYSLLLESGMEKEAAEILTKIEGIEGDSSDDQFQRAKLHYYQGDYETALVELEESYTKGYTEALFFIGEIYRQKKDYQRAIYYYETYLTDGMIQTPNVYNQIGYCLIKTGDYLKAIDYLEKGIAMNHAGIRKALLKNEIIAYESLGEFELALEKLQKYLENYPNDLEAKREETFLKTRTIVTEIKDLEEE